MARQYPPDVALPFIFYTMINDIAPFNGSEAQLPWENESRPGHGRDEKYQELCQTLASLLGCSPGGIDYIVTFGDLRRRNWGEIVRGKLTPEGRVGAHELYPAIDAMYWARKTGFRFAN